MRDCVGMVIDAQAVEAIANGPALWDAVLAKMPAGSIIAGGAIRDHFLGVPPKDIDVFLHVQDWPKDSFPGFETLGADKNEEYAALPTIAVVVRGRIEGYQVDIVGIHWEEGYTPANLIETFDVGEIHDTPEAAYDRENRTVTLLVADRPDRSRARFDRFNARMPLTYLFAAARTLSTNTEGERA